MAGSRSSILRPQLGLWEPVHGVPHTPVTPVAQDDEGPNHVAGQAGVLFLPTPSLDGAAAECAALHLVLGEEPLGRRINPSCARNPELPEEHELPHAGGELWHEVLPGGQKPLSLWAHFNAATGRRFKMACLDSATRGSSRSMPKMSVSANILTEGLDRSRSHPRALASVRTAWPQPALICARRRVQPR